MVGASQRADAPESKERVKCAMPAVTITVPCFNEEEFIESTLRSLMAQTERDIEILVCDNASSDSTPEIVERLGQEDARIKLLPSEKNLGGRQNFIRAFALGDAPYFMWAGAHDLYAPEFVENLKDSLDRNPDAVISFCDSVFIDRSGRTVENPPPLAAFELTQSDPAERFIRLIWQLNRCDMLHGLMRRGKVDIRPMERVQASPDMAFLPAQALYGTILRVPKLMFFRRKNRGDEGISDVKKHLVADGYADESTSYRDIFTAIREAHFLAIRQAPLSGSKRNHLDIATRLCFKERFGIPFDLIPLACWKERLKLHWFGATDRARKRIVNEIRERLLSSFIPSDIEVPSVVRRRARRK